MGPGEHGLTTVRPATPADADAVARVHTTSWRETYARLVADVDTDPSFALGPRTTMWRTLLAEGADAVAAGPDGVVGFAATAPTPEPDAVRPEELTMFYVLASAHGTGVGQALLDATLATGPRRSGSRRTTRAHTPSTGGTASPRTAPSRPSAR